MKTRIFGGTVVLDNAILCLDLLSENGLISLFTTDSRDIDADQHIDASGMMVLPGAIDAHTHFRQPDPNSFEGFETGGAAAAAGGITTVVEMPQGGPTTATVEDFSAKIESIRANSIIDFGLWGGFVGDDDRDENQILGMSSLGAAGLKSFMASSSPSFPAVDMDKLFWAMKVIARTGVRYGLHAEDNVMVLAGIERMKADGRMDPMAHAESRPPLVEYVAVDAALYLGERTGCPIHICHCASVSALRLISDAKRRGVDVTVETCPQYLALNSDDLFKRKGFARCAPALREQSEVDGIWDAIADGVIDMVSSDHSSYLAETKASGESDIFNAPLGVTGVQTLLPVLWETAVHQRGFSPSRIAQLLASGPATIFGLDDRKGSIGVGKDADVLLFDPDFEWTIHGEDMLHRQKWTPFEGKTVRGRVVRSIRRGETLYEDPMTGGRGVTAAPGSGRYLPRRQA